MTIFEKYDHRISHASILCIHKLRCSCHIALFLLSCFLLLSTSVVLAYSIKIYYGSYLHAIPELLAASLVILGVLGMAWLPSDEYVGVYGLKCMRTVLQEICWSGALSLGIFAGVTSLHSSTPGLMDTCGRFLICRGYITIFVSAWLSWLMISIPFGLLITSAIFQILRRRGQMDGKSVWQTEVARYEYFWPGEFRRRSLFVARTSRAVVDQPTISESVNQQPDLDNEKNDVIGSDFKV